MTITVVLGHQLKKGGALDPVGRSRLEHLIRLDRARPSDTIILSGGVKPWISTRSEAQAMAHYLHGRGIPREKILLEQGSLTTGMNLLFTLPKAAAMKPDCIRILSSRVHLLRPVLNPVRMTRLLMLPFPGIRLKFSGSDSPAEADSAGGWMIRRACRQERRRRQQ